MNNNKVRQNYKIKAKNRNENILVCLNSFVSCFHQFKPRHLLISNWMRFFFSYFCMDPLIWNVRAALIARQKSTYILANIVRIKCLLPFLSANIPLAHTHTISLIKFIRVSGLTPTLRIYGLPIIECCTLYIRGIVRSHPAMDQPNEPTRKKCVLFRFDTWNGIPIVLHLEFREMVYAYYLLG